MNQVRLHPPCFNWFHPFTVLASLLNSFYNYDACTTGHQSQEGDLLYLARNELGSIVPSICKIVQIYFSLFIANWEFDVSIISSNQFHILGDYHSIFHFPMSISNDCFFTLFDSHCSTSFYSYFFQIGEALQPSFMVMESPNCLGMTIEDGQIYFSSQDSHHDPIYRIENSPFQRS